MSWSMVGLGWVKSWMQRACACGHMEGLEWERASLMCSDSKEGSVQEISGASEFSLGTLLFVGADTHMHS